MYTKQCTTCCGVFTSEHFYRNISSPDGLQPTCKSCCRVASAKWKKQNPKKTRQHYQKAGVMRRFRIKVATPKWLTQEELDDIKQKYVLAKLCTEATEIPHHVDHIVPLGGKKVCGLNVPWNLQIISAEENHKKGNKHV